MVDITYRKKEMRQNNKDDLACNSGIYSLVQPINKVEPKVHALSLKMVFIYFMYKANPPNNILLK